MTTTAQLKTIPWNENEFVRFNGLDLCYEVTRGGEINVHLLGGETLPFHKLIGAKMPSVLRTVAFAYEI